MLRELAKHTISFGYNKSLKFYYRDQPTSFLEVYRSDALFLDWVRKSDFEMAKRYVHFHGLMNAHLGL